MDDASARPSWDQVFMEFASALANRSTCRRAKVGSVVVTADNHRILSMGYNGGYRGGPNGCDSDEVGNCGCLHSEDNCLLKMNFNEAAPKKMYVTSSPCVACAKRIINAGISTVIFRDLYRKTEGLGILKEAGIPVFRYASEDGLVQEY